MLGKTLLRITSSTYMQVHVIEGCSLKRSEKQLVREQGWIVASGEKTATMQRANILLWLLLDQCCWKELWMTAGHSSAETHCSCSGRVAIRSKSEGRLFSLSCHRLCAWLLFLLPLANSCIPGRELRALWQKAPFLKLNTPCPTN